ncbi:MAG: ABC transporter ATP-binding protein [Candidatus Calescibacterium sp.]
MQEKNANSPFENSESDLRYKETIKYIFSFIKKHLKIYVKGISATVASAFFSAITPIFVKKGIEALEKGTTKDFIVLVGLAITLFGIIRSVLLYIGRILIIRAGRLVEKDIRDDIFKSTLPIKTEFFDKEGTGKISSVIINDIENVRMMLGSGGIIISHIMPVFIMSVIGEFLINPKLTLISLIPIFSITFVVIFFQKRIFIISENVQDKLSEISDFSQEKISSIRIIKSFAIEEEIQEKFKEKTEDYIKINLKLAKEGGKFDALSFLLAELSLLFVVIFGGKMVIDNEIPKSTLAGFIAYQIILTWPAMAMGYLVVIIQRGLASLWRVQKLKYQEKEQDIDNILEIISVSDDNRKSKISLQTPNIRIIRSQTTEYHNSNLKYDIEIKKLNYGILKDINLKIPEGKKIGIVGKTGSGKTTLLQLIMKLYIPPEEAIFIGGEDICKKSTYEIRKILSAVFQENFFFSGTIKENVILGKGDFPALEMNGKWYYDGNGYYNGNEAKKDENEIKKEVEMYLKIANFDFLSFPKGIEEIIGEKGIKLSGGQKERLALARALIKNPKILILDDAFANIDTKTEEEIIKSLFKFVEEKNMTLIFATHRVKNLVSFDTILELDKGQIINIDTPSNLLKNKNSIFSNFYKEEIESSEIL